MLIKLSIVFGCGYFIWQKLNSNDQLKFSDFYQNLIENHIISSKNLVFLLFFTFLNWFLEIKKWQILVLNIKKIHFLEAAKQSLASLTTSLLTPNRIGEYGAKALYFEKSLRKKILSLNFIGNLHQLFATVFFGLIGLFYLINTQNVPLNLTKISYAILMGFVIIFGSLFLWKFLKSKENLFRKYSVKISVNEHCKIGLFSFLRYLIFSHQFYFLLIIFKADVSYIDALSATCAMYLISSFIPMLSVFDAVLKGTVAIFIFTFLNLNTLTILSITTFMWILNFAIPAMIGSYFVLTFKLKLVT